MATILSRGDELMTHEPNNEIFSYWIVPENTNMFLELVYLLNINWKQADEVHPQEKSIISLYTGTSHECRGLLIRR